MKELLYMWIDSVSNRANILRQGILFSNDYSVELDREKVFDDIVSLHICKKDNIYRNFYGDKIASISALVGVNGVGKTTILDILGSSRDIRKRYLYDWRFFLIYKMDDRYIVEGNGKDIVENFIKNIPEYANDEFSFICEYDDANGKFIFVDFCSATGEIEDSVKFYYFQDKPEDKYGYMVNDYQLEPDYNVCFERIDMRPDAASIYKTSYYFKDSKEFNLHINLYNLRFWIDAKNDYIIRPIMKHVNIAMKEVFVIRTLLSVVKNMKNGREVLSALPIDHDNNIFNYDPQKNNEYKSILVEAIDSYDFWFDEEIVIATDLVNLLEQIPEKFFPRESNNRVGLHYVNMRFSIQDTFSEDIYLLLKKYSEFLTFSYSGISAGEKKIFDVFTGFFVHINKMSDIEVQGEKTNIILLDEPDKGLHPDMSRRFIYWLTKLFTDIKVGSHKYQFILTTHSPFLISDIPNPFVHCLKYYKNEKGGWFTEIADSKYGLLNSIPDIMKDTFFMDSPFGEFGNQYYIDLVSGIEKLQTLRDAESVNLLKQKICAVNDSILRKYLEKTFEEKIASLGSVEQQLMYYEEKIKELRGKNNGTSS